MNAVGYGVLMRCNLLRLLARCVNICRPDSKVLVTWTFTSMLVALTVGMKANEDYAVTRSVGVQ